MRIKINSSKILNAIVLIFLLIISIFYVYPILWLFDASLRPLIDIFQVPPALFSGSFEKMFGIYTFNSFINSFLNWGTGIALINSVLVTCSSIILTVFVCSLCSYAFAFMNFPGKKIIFIFILSTMMLPLATMIAPYYRVLQKLGLTNKLIGLIIPYAAYPLGVFLLKQYFIKIPVSLIEAAKIDGAGYFRIWLRIIMPLSKPALAAFAIIQFKEVWNDFLIPMIVLRSGSLFTLPIKLQLMDSQTFNKPYDAIIATGFITAIIPIIFFLIFQRYFIEGLTGGIKG
ncbi:MAG: carbohydrate ABC transporter permease [Spirochaetes bacterium]|nr:carbohydrate ABC transporter permease [Spirochaetota bacterium]